MLASERGKANQHLLVILDQFTQWIQAYPVPTKDTEEVRDRLLTFFGLEYHPDYQGESGKTKVPSMVYADNVEEYRSALTGFALDLGKKYASSFRNKRYR